MTGNDSTDDEDGARRVPIENHDDEKAESEEETGEDEDGPTAIPVERPDDEKAEPSDEAGSSNDDGAGEGTVDFTPDADRWLGKLDDIRKRWREAKEEEQKQKLRDKFEKLSSELHDKGVLDDDEMADLGESDQPEETNDDAESDRQAEADNTVEAVEPEETEPDEPDSTDDVESDRQAEADDTVEAVEPEETEPDEPDESVGIDDAAEGDEQAETEAGEPADAEELRADLEEALNRIDDLEELMSEYQRKNEREHRLLEKDALESFATRMFGVRDTLERLLEYGEWDDESADQLRSLLRQFDQQLTAKRIDAIDPDRGDEVDSSKHRIEGQEEAEDVGPGRILRVESKGYEISGYPLRPAEVVVTKGE
ncbi:nucleotide exchange factor GrpE [Haloplanus rubicundus]|nr:nucleotide exchange factor GrpE [Haloplanus rubicundus]